MIKKLTTTLMAAMLVAGMVSESRAETLLGKDYAGGLLEITKFGDDYLDDLLGLGYGLEGFVNVNLHDNIDLNLGLGYLWAEGDDDGVDMEVDGVVVEADLIYFFKPGEKVNPYVSAGLALVDREVEVTVAGDTESDGDTEVGYGAGAGVELELTAKTLLRLGVDYFNIDDEDSVELGGFAGYWFTDRLLGTIGGGYDFEYEDTYARIGFIVEL